ncbi:MAG: hypothetical protein Q9167_001177 [Letrouitia subvulpina]
MSPSAVPESIADDHFEPDLNLSLLGLGVEYPPYRVGPEALEVLAKRFYPTSAALKKVLSINRFTGIETRATIGEVDHPLVNQPNAPTIKQLNDFFQQEGVRLSVNACKKSVQEWGGRIEDITHIVSTTCTNSANPGFDHLVIKELGIDCNVEKILLHGVGCSGGLAAIRTAANLALGSTYRKKPARVLVLACEISSLLVRSELDSINEEQQTRIGVCLFSDCASSAVLSNGIGENESELVYEMLGWRHEIINDTAGDLGFDVDPLGWKVVLSPRVPSLSAKAVEPAFQNMVNSIPELHKASIPLSAADFDWALHPGGSLIITGIEQAMNLTQEHLRASYDIYMNYGNSSSATIISVMNRLREMGDGRDHVIACAFGPGIALEMMVLRRRKPDVQMSIDTAEPSNTLSTNGTSTVNGITTSCDDSLNSELTITNGATSKNGLSTVGNGELCTNKISAVIGNGSESHLRSAANSLPVEDLD